MAESQWTRREFLEISFATGAGVTAGALPSAAKRQEEEW